MRSEMHINQHTFRSVTASRNPGMVELVSVEFAENGDGGQTIAGTLTAREHIWQQVVDQLAALGITASHETTPNVPRLAVAGKFREYQGGAL